MNYSDWLSRIKSCINTQHIQFLPDAINEINKMPVSLDTKEACKTVVRINPLCLYHVPSQFIDKEICLIAFRNNKNFFRDGTLLLSWTPNNLQDEHLLWVVNNKSGNNYPQRLAAANIIRSWVIKWLYRPSGLRTRKMMYSACS